MSFSVSSPYSLKLHDKANRERKACELLGFLMHSYVLEKKNTGFSWQFAQEFLLHEGKLPFGKDIDMSVCIRAIIQKKPNVKDHLFCEKWEEDLVILEDREDEEWRWGCRVTKVWLASPYNPQIHFMSPSRPSHISLSTK